MDLFRGGLRAVAFAFGTNNTLDKILEIADVSIGPDDDIVKSDPGKPATIGDWFNWVKGVVKKGWEGLISINPMRLVHGFKAWVSRLIGDAIMPLWNFNWNITDEELDQQYAALFNQLGGQLGGTLGGLVGGLVCGSAVVGAEVLSQRLLQYNDATALRLIVDQGEEVLDELYDNLRGLSYTLGRMALNAAFVKLFKSFRRGIKTLFQNPDSWQSRALRNVFGDGINEVVSRWGNKGEKPWSFALATENIIEQIPNPFFRNLAEEFVEEFLEACRNSFYIAANTWEQAAIAPELILGQQRVVEITPDRERENEKIIIGGNEKLLKPLIVQTVQQERSLANRDVGIVLGQQMEQLAFNLKGIDTPQVDIIIRYYSQKQPPFSRNYKTADDFLVKVPQVVRGRLDWERVKNAAGGRSGYLAGGNRLVAHLGQKSNGLEVDTLEIWCGAEDEGQDLARTLVQLTDLEILWFEYIKQDRGGTHGLWRWIDPIKVYPAHLTVINYEKIIREQEKQGVPPAGIYRGDKFLFELWPNTKPPQFDRDMGELLSPTT